MIETLNWRYANCSNGKIVRIIPGKRPQISYDDGDVWQDIDISDVSETVIVEITDNYLVRSYNIKIPT